MNDKTCNPNQSNPSSTNHDSEPKEPTLSSRIKVSPHTHSHPTYLDGVSLLKAVRSNPSPQLKVNLPSDLSRTFGFSKVQRDETGYIRCRSSIETNGALLDRVILGLPDPNVGSKLLNQIHDDEAAIWSRHQGNLTPYETQIADLIATYDRCYSFLDQVFGNIKLMGQRLVRTEFYREYSSPLNEAELFDKMEAILGRKYGRPRLRDNGEGDLGECRIYIIQTPGLRRYHCRNQFCGVKIYRKGNRIRIEVEFVNFPVPGLREHDGVPFKTDHAVRLIGSYMEELGRFADTVLDVVQADFFSTPSFIAVGKLQQKLTVDYRMKKVLTDPAICAFVRSLEAKGYYCRREIPKGKLLSHAQMRALRHPVTGILERVPRPSTGKKSHLSYRLKPNWEVATAPAKPPKAPTAAQLAIAAIEAVKASVSLSEVTRSKVEAAIRSAINLALKKPSSQSQEKTSVTATVEA